MKPDIATLREKFQYFPESGEVTFAVDSGRYGRCKKGSRAGSVDAKGQRVISVLGKNYMESSVAWAMHYGEWPPCKLARKDGMPTNNAIANLYLATADALSLDRVRELLAYDGASGEFIWKVNKPPHARRGDIAGRATDGGYVLVSVDGFHIRAHRLAWWVAYGTPVPEGLEIDHINGIRSDNRIENLRQVTRAQNSQNTFLRSDSTTGVKGVTLRADTGRYSATITVNGAAISLGCFPSLAAAEASRQACEHLLHSHRKTS